MAIRMEFVRMFQMMPRDGAHAEVAQELRLIQHPAEKAFHAMTAQERKQMALFHAGFVPAGDELGEVETIVKKPFEAIFELGHFLKQGALEDFDGEQRDETDDRTDFERFGATIGQVEN